MNCILLFLVAITTAPVSNAQCTGSMSSGVYNVSWAVSGGNVDFTVSVDTTGWIGVGFSLTSFMPDSDIVVGATNGMLSFVEDRWAVGRFQPPFDTQQNLENTEINIQDGRTTMSFRRALVTTDNNNEDLNLNQCVRLLRAWGGSVSSYNSPASFGNHFSNNRGVFSTELCLQDCVVVPTQTSSSTTSSVATTTTEVMDGFEVASSLEFTFTTTSVQVQMTPPPVIDACSSNPCDQNCTVIDGGFECSCMEGFVLESDSTSCEELTTLELQNRVRLTLINETRETFNEGKQYLFRNATARAMNNYCRQNPDDCDIITDSARSFRKRLIPRTLLPLLKRQDTPSVLASDIIIISIVDTSNGLQVTFFVRIMSGVISAQAIADAVQEAIDDGVYSTAGFTVTDVTIVDPPPTPDDDDDDDDGLSSGQIAGIVIGVVVGVPLFLVILSLLAYCLGRQKNSKQRSASIPQTDDELAMRKVPKDPFSREAQGSVHSVKMTFVGVQDSDDEEEGKRYN